ncbi:MAG: hypothetical protein J7J36_06720 [Thermoplasmata archaeon]|nr:hypothetical protein [Thermoplasmata archaeon]
MKSGVIISRIFEAFLLFMAFWSFYKHDLLWAFACIVGFILSISPIILKKSFNFSVPWIIEFLLVFIISLHIWGGVLHLYSLPLYDKFAHFFASGIIAFFALIVIYVIDSFSIRIHMDLAMLALFTIIFTIAIGALWEIAEFAFDQIFSHGIPAAQISLYDTMTDLIADTIAGLIIGILGAMAIRRGELKNLLAQISRETKKLNKKFFDKRNNALKSLEKAIYESKVDKKAISIIKKINEKSDFFTTSSCSGRIVVMELPSPGKKRKAKFLGKWHHEINEGDVYNAIKQAKNGEIWFFVHPPIFHVSAISIKSAKIMLNIAIQSGFKNSSIKAFNGRVTTEILSTEKMDVPIGKDGKLYVSNEYIKLLIEISNILIKKMDKKLKRFEKNLNKI